MNEKEKTTFWQVGFAFGLLASLVLMAPVAYGMGYKHAKEAAVEAGAAAYHTKTGKIEFKTCEDDDERTDKP